MPKRCLVIRDKNYWGNCSGVLPDELTEKCIEKAMHITVKAKLDNRAICV